MKRYIPLDVFRGMTIAFMILVNTPGSWNHIFAPFKHANWHGFTPTDLIFPTFLFVVGNAMAFVSIKWQKINSSQVFIKGLKRAALIFLVGLLLNWFPFFEIKEGAFNFISFANVRIFGVLQRIALCYALALPFIYYFNTKKLVGVSAIFLLLYWLLMSVFGDYSLQGNAAVKLDLWLLSPSHLYMGEGVPFDPEGLLSTIPATVNVFFGFIVGSFLREKEISYKQLSLVMLIGVATLFIGYFWNYLFPINKKLWTSSYTLYTIGLSSLVLALVMYFMSFAKNRFTFNSYNIMGKNPLFLYVLSGVLAKLLYTFGWYTPIYENAFQWMGDKLGSLIFAIVFTFLHYLVALWLDKRKIYIKL